MSERVQLKPRAGSRKTSEGQSKKRGRPRAFDRNETLRKAMLLFWEQGYEATTMADLRATLGLTQASLYAAYSSKEKLFREAVDLYRSTAGSSSLAAIATGQTAQAAMEGMLMASIQDFTHPGMPRGCLVVLSCVSCPKGSSDIETYLRHFRSETTKSIVRRLKQGQRDGDVPKTVSLPLVGEFYTTVIHGLSIQARDGTSKKQLMRVAQVAMSSWDLLIAT